MNKEAKFYKRVCLFLAFVIIVMALQGCEEPRVSDWRGSRYYYDIEACPWVNNLLNKAVINVLPYGQFKKAAGRSITPILGFSRAWVIWLPEGYLPDSKFHELGHVNQYLKGEPSGHEAPCWKTSKPYGYDKKVIAALDGIAMP